MAAATEEQLRITGSVVPGVGEVEEVDEATEGGRLGRGDDDEILRFMDSVDGYLLLMDSLSSVLRPVRLPLSAHPPPTSFLVCCDSCFFSWISFALRCSFNSR
jgi:hypothetical protein